MAELFDNVFNPEGIHRMLFFNVKSVLIYPTLDELRQNDDDLFKRWRDIALSNHNGRQYDADMIYDDKAASYPEFNRVVAITYATVYLEDGVLKRYLKRIVNEDEHMVIATFMEELHQLTNVEAGSKPFIPMLCGHDILNHDIPLLVKKCIKYREKLGKPIPLILKKSLTMKPWDSGIIDVINVWKFNGYGKMPLMLISDYLGLKKTIDLDDNSSVSRQYWELRSNGKDAEALEYISLQSATQTNLVIQLMNVLRNL